MSLGYVYLYAPCAALMKKIQAQTSHCRYILVSTCGENKGEIVGFVLNLAQSIALKYSLTLRFTNV